MTVLAVIGDGPRLAREVTRWSSTAGGDFAMPANLLASSLGDLGADMTRTPSRRSQSDARPWRRKTQRRLYA